MWSPLGIKNFIFKDQVMEDGLIVYLSDFVHIWNVNLKNEEILAIAKEMNPLIEAPQVKLIEKVVSLLDRIQEVNKKLEEIDSHVILHLVSDMSGIKFQFQLKLKIQNGNLLFKELTLPFILLASRLQLQQNKLIEIIRKKDAEINEYKRENITIKRTQLITRPFDFIEVRKEEDDALTAIAHDPTSAFDIISTETFANIAACKVLEKEKSEVELDKNKQKNLSSTISSKPFPTNKHRKINFSKKVKSKIEIQINSSNKKNIANQQVALKF